MKKNSRSTLGLIFSLLSAIVSPDNSHGEDIDIDVHVHYVSDENSIRKLKESADDIPVRVCWSGLKMFLGGSPEQREKFKNTLHQCLVYKRIDTFKYSMH